MQIIEGPLATDRLTVHHLTVPRDGAPKVLLLGGSNFDLRLKRAFLDASIADEVALATYEPRGIGRTGQPDGIWTMEDYARDAIAVLDALEWGKAIVIGESFGGMTALHLALMAPERVRGLIIASATAGGPEHASYDIAEFLGLPVEDAAERALCLQDKRNIGLRDKDPAAFAAALDARIGFETAFRNPSIASGGYGRLLQARRGHDCVARLGQIPHATTIIAGRYDMQARPEAQEALAKGLPNAAFALLDSGHGVLFAHPEAARIATAAIKKLSATKETAP